MEKDQDMDMDDEHVLDQCAMEAIYAIESRNTPQFLEAMKALIAHTIVTEGMQDDDESEEAI